MNVHFLNDVVLALAQKQHLETVMKAIKESALQGLWIGRPFVHQPAKDCCRNRPQSRNGTFLIPTI
jgi:hypothetical protein